MITFNFAKTPITQIADSIIIDASNRGASDIHMDPRENGLMIRYRVDGDLTDYAYIPKVYERNLATRIKLMGGMNITESRLPQDGAIKGKFGGKDLDMRVSSLPTNEGEKIVIRILDYTRSLSGLGNLGFNKENYQKLLRMIGNPNGIILVTGATGSGKSTTVYSVLQVLNREETNIITVEDPIEMNIEGMNQVQVNSDIGLDFAVVLRSILRQDPNVILIGEIRDSETAQIAVRASITGHLVLSTIHTNNSLSTIERLLDMNVERYLLSSAISGIISQRLAKMLCPKCRRKVKVNPYERKVFKLALDKDVEEIYAANPNGCKECHKGYKGRVAIQEVLEVDDKIRSVINGTGDEKDGLRKLVYGTGNVITLLQDALGKVLTGETSFEEVYRIIEVDNDIDDSCLATGKNPEELRQLQKELDEEAKRRAKEEEEKKLLAAKKATEKEQKRLNALQPKASNNQQQNPKLIMKSLTEDEEDNNHLVKIPVLLKTKRKYSKLFFPNPLIKLEKNNIYSKKFFPRKLDVLLAKDDDLLNIDISKTPETKQKPQKEIKKTASKEKKKETKEKVVKSKKTEKKIEKVYSENLIPRELKKVKLIDNNNKKDITEYYNIKDKTKKEDIIIKNIDYKKIVEDLQKAYNLKPTKNKKSKLNKTEIKNVYKSLDKLNETYGLPTSYILNKDLKYITPKISLNTKGKNKNKHKFNINNMVFK